MAARRRPRPFPRRPALLAATAATGLAGAALAQRRHLRTLAGDPELRALSAPLGGRRASVTSADGTELHVQRFGGAADNAGETAATLVLAHGWTERIDFWGPVIRRLAGPGLELIAYDLRGHGDSAPAVDDDYSLQRFGEDLDAVLGLCATPPARTAVAGHSLGAMSIAAWAQAFAVDERVAAVALVNTGLSDLIGGALVLGEIGARITPRWVGRAMLGSGRPMLAASTPLSHAAARHTAFGPDASDGAVAFYERMLTATEPRARAATGIALSTLDLTDAVARITVPTLVVAGARDRLTPPAHAERIVAALPDGARLLVLPRTGHMSPLERPDELAGALGELLANARVSGAPAALRPEPSA